LSLKRPANPVATFFACVCIACCAPRLALAQGQVFSKTDTALLAAVKRAIADSAKVPLRIDPLPLPIENYVVAKQGSGWRFVRRVALIFLE
jgi:hypothetical protein